MAVHHGWDARPACTNCVQEATHLQHLRHPNVVALYGIALTKTKGIVVMELCEGRDLHSALQVTVAGSSERLFSWRRRGRRVALEVARALNYLHSRGVAHMDVKSANILLTVSGTGAAAWLGEGSAEGASKELRRLAGQAALLYVARRCRFVRLWHLLADAPACHAPALPSAALLFAAKLADVAFSRQKVHTFFSGSVPVVGTFAW